jgi:hypothetical protein
MKERLNTSLPRRRGEVRRGVLSINGAEKVRNAPSK